MTERRPWLLPAAALLLIAAVFLAVRYWLASTALLSETYYDEALTGLMGLAILHGQPQVFYWGQPYLGAIEGYVAAAGFWLTGVPSGFVLRMAAVTAALFWAWSAWSLGRRIAGDAAGLVAGLWVALPPVFLSFAQLSAHGQSISVTLGALVLAAGAALLDDRLGRRGRAVAWAVLGVAGGLGWWASQMMGMFLVAAAVAILVARPRVLREPGPYGALGLFVLASLPFWVWNVRHEWATFWHLATWGEPLPPSWAVRGRNVGGALLETLRGFFWDDRAVPLSRAVSALDWAVIATAYVPALALAAWQAGVWGWRLGRRERPWREPLDVVALAFWLTVAAHLLTWFGTSGVLRYSMTFYATVPVLGAVALARVAAAGRAGRVAAGAVAVALFALHGSMHAAFARVAAGAPWRPVDAAIRTLDRLGIRACYADSRIAQVITFESAERIECADYYGLRNFAFLRAVDAVADPATVALVTHRVLEGPAPAVMDRALAMVGGEETRTVVGDYVIYHHFRPPDDRVRPIEPEGWRAWASTDGEGAREAFDRKVWTRWTAARPARQWLEVDLGREHRLAGVSLLTAPLVDQAPADLLVETSVDGRHWDRAAAAADLLTGVHWWKGHPRVDESGRVIVRLSPRPARYVRLTHGAALPAGGHWSVAELFAYETAETPWTPPPAAVAALDTVQRELAHWMDDPAGPHPKRAPVTYAHRRAQVDWARLFAAGDQAMAAAPDWEEAHHLYGEALALSSWSKDWDELVERSRRDGAWPEVLRWAEMAADQQPDLWRSGRESARVEALGRLGRAEEARAVQAAADRRPIPPLRVRYGKDLELAGIEWPAQARPGDRVVVRYAWRALRRLGVNYTAFVHLDGAGHFDQDHRLGGSFGTSAWAAGERVEETLTLRVPPGTPPGTYLVRAGVWVPETRRRLRIAESDRSHTGHAAVVATLTVLP